ALHPRRQRHGPLDDRTGALGGVDDLEGGLVDQLVVERLQADADLLFLHDCSFKERCGPWAAYAVGKARPRRRSRARASCKRHSMILETTPAPTVRPPSRMAKRRPSSMAIGAISLTVIPTLSPGITISLSCGNSTEPVTSV